MTKQGTSLALYAKIQIALANLSVLTFHHMPLAPLARNFFEVMLWINFMLAIFNLLSIPPLDGNHFLRALLPKSFLLYYYHFEGLSFIALIFLLALVEQFRELLL